jgi:hypothetical protein
MLIPRGDCEFVTKALNAQRLGAQLAVIMDDKIHDNLVIMVDNNYGNCSATQVIRSRSLPFSSTTWMDSCCGNC